VYHGFCSKGQNRKGVEAKKNKNGSNECLQERKKSLNVANQSYDLEKQEWLKLSL
jgi:hypothetical protein